MLLIEVLRRFLPLFAQTMSKEKRGQDDVETTSLPAEGRGTE
ncbi:hypothetical protein [Ruegeria sp. EL01]|nr:hypothetical protein [Ruegeria sp. EL01]